MPNLSLYRKMHSPLKNGEVRKMQSDDIENYTWWEDIAARKAFLCDWYNDAEPTKLVDMHPERYSSNIPIDIKLKLNQTQTYTSDQVTFHIELRPGQKCNVPYYKEMFEDRYDAEFPIGMYCIIPDERGIYRRWLVVGKANFYGTQFPTFEVLPCGYVFRYIIDGIKYEVPCVLRSQSSY